MLNRRPTRRPSGPRAAPAAPHWGVVSLFCRCGPYRVIIIISKGAFYISLYYTRRRNTMPWDSKATTDTIKSTPRPYRFIRGYTRDTRAVDAWGAYKLLTRDEGSRYGTKGAVSCGNYQEQVDGAVKMYFDFEQYYPTAAAQAADAAPMLRDITNMLETDLSVERFAVLESNGRKVAADGSAKHINSYHIIVNDECYVFDCGATLLRFLDAHIPATFGRVFDRQVYGGPGAAKNFRAPFQRKGDGYMRDKDGRPHIVKSLDLRTMNPMGPCDRKNMSDYLIASITDIAIHAADYPPAPGADGGDVDGDEADEMFTEAAELLRAAHPEEFDNFRFDVAWRKGGSFFGRRIQPSMCLVCHVKHENDNSAVIVVRNGGDSILYSCTRRKANMPKSRVIVLRAGTAIKLSQKELIIAALESKGAAGADIPAANMTVSAARFADAPGVELAIFESPAAIIGIRSPMGSGKSWAMSRMIAARPDARVLVITMRISLSEKYRTDYPGFAHYHDATGPIAADRAIVVLDSVRRISLEKQFDYVILDEAEAVVSHLTSSTFMKQDTVVDSFERLINIFNRAGRIIAMDANLSNHTIAAITMLSTVHAARETTTHIITNTHIAASRDIQITESKNVIIGSVIDALDARRRVYVASNYSARVINVIRDTIRGRLRHDTGDIKVLTITRDTLCSEPVKAALADPNAEWGKYDLVICSPSIQSGISYDLPDFDHVYGIFCNLTNSCSDMHQQLARVRHPKNNKVLVSIKIHNNPNINVSTHKEFADHLTERQSGVANHVALARGLIRYTYNAAGVAELAENVYYRLYRDNLIRANADLRSMYTNFIRLGRECGHTVRYYDGPVLNYFENKNIDVHLGVVKAEHGADDDKNLAAMPNINQAYYDELTEALKGDKLPYDEVLGARFTQQRYRLMRQFNMAPDAKLTPEWFAAYKNSGGAFRNLMRYAPGFVAGLEETLAAEVAADTAARQRGGDINLFVHMVHGRVSYKKHKMLLDILTAWGITDLAQGTVTADNIRAATAAFLMDPVCVAQTLGMRSRAVATLSDLKADSPTYVRFILKAINPALKETFGLSLRASKRKNPVFVVHNDLAAGCLSAAHGDITPRYLQLAPPAEAPAA